MTVYRLLFSFVVLIQTCLSSNETHYTAAVIEYNFSNLNSNQNQSYEDSTNEIINDFVNLIASETAKSFDIIVLPESVITTDINTRQDLIDLSPLIATGNNPCNNPQLFPDYYRTLSCSAANFNTYIVANVVEKSLCEREPCASDGYDLYNTNVVFDRAGFVAARYRKFHLFGEYEKNVTEEVDLTTFKTDFGVNFGTFICFDILFEEPSLWLTRNGTKHLAFPSMWFSEAPFLTALQVQNMFAVTTDSVLLASGANYPAIGSGGSGFYIGVEGPKNIGIVSQGGTKIFIADLPKDLNRNSKRNIQNNQRKKSVEEIDQVAKSLDEFYLKRDQLDVYTTHLITENINSTYCHEDFCCKFVVEFTNTQKSLKSYYYRIFIYSGVRTFGGIYGGVDVCAVSFCNDTSLESCGRRIIPYEDIEWNLIFENIEITGNFDDSKRKQQYPNSLLSDLEPLQAVEYAWESDESNLLSNGKIERKIKLLTSQERLLTFGIYGRDFTRDSSI
ncbi:vanin-like protein 1 isoform X1 [Onthophagus taurus]|uniref:vanin-like protein 1 isoform X1 n=1 Tax=Onthophagus taurus TaxID=166361 RepID=UPI0039BE42BA